MNGKTASVFSSESTSVGGPQLEAGSGEGNTDKIITEYPNDTVSTAAASYSTVSSVNGKTYDDWFLPSSNELNGICIMKNSSTSLNTTWS